MGVRPIGECALCGGEAVDRHHVKYHPEQVIVRLCNSCHSEVHASDDHPLSPDREWKEIPMAERTAIKRGLRNGNYELLESV